MKFKIIYITGCAIVGFGASVIGRDQKEGWSIAIAFIVGTAWSALLAQLI